MPLPSPILDNRSYKQLRDELIRRIPVYAPEWSDHNASDPGITLLELFAFLGENLLFRFNQIPEATKLGFLRLVDLAPRTASTARALVTLTGDDPAGTLVKIGEAARAGDKSFELQTEVRVWPLTVRAIARTASDAPDDPEERAFAARAIAARGLRSDEEAVFYVNDTVPPDPLAPGAEAVDFSRAVDGVLWVAVLRGRTTDPDKLLDGVVNLGFIPDQDVLRMEEVDPCPGADGEAAPSPPVTWEISTGSLEDGEPVYRRLEVVGDTTRGLTREGVVRVRLPRRREQVGLFPFADADELGTGNRPPDLEDDELSAKLLFWLRAFHEDMTPLPRVLWVGPNAGESEHAQRAAVEYLGMGTGDADQTVKLVNKPVLVGSLVLEVEEQDGWIPWIPADDFVSSNEDDRHYVLDAAAGTARFGNGMHGRAPQIGERIRASSYQYGGGRAGNVAAGAISKLPTVPGVKATNPLPARGGRDAESVGEALDRVPAELRRRDRAVTADDFAELALATPGGDVGRAEPLPRFHPKTRNAEAAGIVSVVVWPKEDRKRPTAPAPDRSLLRAVCEWLDKRRLITTELYVIPPTYRKLDISVGIRVKPGYGVEAVRNWVDLVVRQYLAPLPPYGPAGSGWPLGRDVYGPELEAAALQVEGVEFLEGLLVRGHEQRPGDVDDRLVALELWEVPEVATVSVVAGDALPPGQQPQPAEPERLPVPIPTLKEQC